MGRTSPPKKIVDEKNHIKKTKRGIETKFAAKVSYIKYKKKTLQFKEHQTQTSEINATSTHRVRWGKLAIEWGKLAI